MELDKLIKVNLNLIEECLLLLNKQVEDSYKKIRLPRFESFNLKFKVKDELTIRLLDFYEKFIAYVKFAHNLKYSIIDMDYTQDELMIHINKSPSFIIDLEKTLLDRKNKIQTYHDNIVDNNKLITLSYCKELELDQYNNINMDFIDLIYKFMEFDFKFIPYGVIIITYLFDKDKINDEYKLQITNLSNNLKLKYLQESDDNVDNNTIDKKNVLLQTYNLYPTIFNLTLEEIYNKLFSIKINNQKNKKSDSNIKNNLQYISKSLNKNISFIIISKYNNDYYQDLSNLFDINKLSKINGHSGITKEYIDLFETLHSNNLKNKIEYNISHYNLKSDNNEVYLLWTNDYEYFKLKETPIDTNIVNKILSQSSSDIINLYNKNFENQLLDKIKDSSVVSYKQLKYLSFDIENEEDEFIDNLYTKINKYIKSIKNLNINTKLFDGCLNIIQNEFKTFKAFKSQKNIPSQALLIYNINAVKLACKIEKDIQLLIVNSNSDNDDVSDNMIDITIKNIIKSNDNIYTKFISSYYLQMSVNL